MRTLSTALPVVAVVLTSSAPVEQAQAADSTYAPDPERFYPIFDVTVASTDGWVAPDYVMLRVRSDQGRHSINPVPTLVLLDGRPLAAGESTSGVVGFDVPPGELRIDCNDEDAPVASFVVAS